MKLGDRKATIESNLIMAERAYRKRLHELWASDPVLKAARDNVKSLKTQLDTVNAKLASAKSGD